MHVDYRPEFSEAFAFCYFKGNRHKLSSKLTSYLQLGVPHQERSNREQRRPGHPALTEPRLDAPEPAWAVGKQTQLIWTFLDELSPVTETHTEVNHFSKRAHGYIT